MSDKIYSPKYEYVRLDTQIVKVGKKKYTFLRAYPLKRSEDGSELLPVMVTVTTKDGATKTVPQRINAKLSFDAKEKLEELGKDYPFIVAFDPKVISEFVLKDATGALLVDDEQQPRYILAHQYTPRRAVDADGNYKLDSEGKFIKYMYINDFEEAIPTTRPVSDVSLEMFD